MGPRTYVYGCLHTSSQSPSPSNNRGPPPKSPSSPLPLTPLGDCAVAKTLGLTVETGAFGGLRMSRFSALVRAWVGGWWVLGRVDVFGMDGRSVAGSALRLSVPICLPFALSIDAHAPHPNLPISHLSLSRGRRRPRWRTAWSRRCTRRRAAATRAPRGRTRC